MSYQVELSRKAVKNLEALPKNIRDRITKEIDHLSENPRPNGCKKLSGNEDIYRVRSGDYRVIYQIKDKVLIVLVLLIGHRREIYDRFQGD